MSKPSVDLLVTQIQETAKSKEEIDWATAQGEYFNFLLSNEARDPIVSASPGTGIEVDFDLQFLDLNDLQVKVDMALKLIENGERTKMICVNTLTTVVTDYLSSAGEQETDELEALLEDRVLLEPFSPGWRIAFSCSETCLELCVRAKLWTLARLWLERWKACLLAFQREFIVRPDSGPGSAVFGFGLILEAEGDYHLALQAYTESSILALDDFPVDNDLEEQRSLFNIPDVGRISTSIARAYLQLGKARSDVPDLGGIFKGEYNLLSQSGPQGIRRNLCSHDT